jgi:HYR domain
MSTSESLGVSPAPVASVPVGKYGLEVGSPDGAFALFQPTPEEVNAQALAAALRARSGQVREAEDDVERIVDEASAVTARSEKCVRLFNELAEGKALDPKVVSAELDAMLGLLERLDRSGRQKEALRVARDLAALLALFLRWLDLVQSLELALRNARTLADRGSEAWASHELGSLHLVAGDPAAAEEHLGTALRLKDEAGGHGRCVTRHNLDAAQRDRVEQFAARARRRRRLRRMGGVATLAVVAAGATVLGIIIFGARHAHAGTNVFHGSGPTLTVPKQVVAEATGPKGAPVSYSATVDAGKLQCAPASGQLFGLGKTTVRCRATSPEGTTAGSFPVKVRDTTPPTLQVPASVRREVLGQAATVGFVATAHDRVDGAVDVACSPAPGSPFDLGKTTVRCHAADRRGNIARKQFIVVVAHPPPGMPLISLPADMAVEATGPRGAHVRYTASAKALSGLKLRLRCSPASGALFSLGRHTVTCTASLPGNPARQATFTVTVHDTTGPKLFLPAALRLEADTAAGAIATFDASASDLVDGSVAVTCQPSSGSLLAIGAHLISCRANDRTGNSASDGFRLVVYDAPPTLTVPTDIVTPYTSVRGTSVRYTASASDRIDGPLTPDCAPASGALFKLGKTEITCTATDSAGNQARKSFTITIVDPVPPVLQLPKSFSVWAPFGATTFAVSFNASARDAVDGVVTVVCDPASGSQFAVGKTTQVNCHASDQALNTRTGSFSVTVNETPG